MVLLTLTGNAQINHKMNTNEKTGSLLCDVDSGMCEVPQENNSLQTKQPFVKKPLTIIYYTDPICSSCWGIEPQLRKLKLEYGHLVSFDYRMGGLLPDWTYNSGGISKPADVAGHWDEVSVYYDMPIDGDVWLEDPLHSSYPPSIAFKAAQLQDADKAVVFLRKLREMLFLQKKNITRWEHVEKAAVQSELDPVRLKQDFNGEAKKHFQNDLNEARNRKVRGFPTIFIENEKGESVIVYGSQPYHDYEKAIKQVFPDAMKKYYDNSWEELFGRYATLTVREFQELAELSREEAQNQLEGLFNDGKLNKLETKNGSLYSVK